MPLIVQSVSIVVVAVELPYSPPPLVAELSLMAQKFRVAVPLLAMPPPSSRVVLPLTVQ